jgi:hypothetical protein
MNSQDWLLTHWNSDAKSSNAPAALRVSLP